MQIAFIGVGVMGTAMVKNLIKNGYETHIYSRTKSKCEEAISSGAIWHDDIPSCVKNADIVITIVGYPSDVRQVYLDNGIMDNAKEGSILIDMTTSSPQLAKELYEIGAKKGLKVLDAPVSGGDSGARNATLTIMAGGDEEVFNKVKPVFSAMGKTIVYMGEAGAGQSTKLANQIAISGCVASVAEALHFAKTSGLDAEKVLSTIGTGAAGSWQMTNNGTKMLSGDMAPGFYIKHFIKDMRIAYEEAAKMGQSLPILKEVLDIYEKLSDEGMEDLGTQAICRYYR
ncbi:MAG: NAD(P)-dependent oxidoreductase [Christensenellaceae bacterium]|nr:NAD(P)-dependent oxidoreductase [Christensenellaceae bacterium]